VKPLWVIAPCALLAGGVVYAVVNRQATTPANIEVVHLSSDRSLVWREPQTSAGLCPWRAPDQDRTRFFPTSLSSRDETLILSRQRVELQRRLGHMPGADDNALIVHRILGPEGSPGVVVTRRVRGECGLIELVLAADARGRVVGARIQRHREPATTARALQSETWLGAFRGKDSRSAWQLGQDIPTVPSEAHASAEAILKEARAVLILLDVARHSDSALPPEAVRAGHDQG
jgi:hypothetical protein